MKKTILLIIIFVFVVSLFATGVMAEEKTIIKVAIGGSAIPSAKKLAEMYNESHPGEDVQILEMPDSSTDSLNLYLQFFEAKSSEVDILVVDVVWPGIIADHLIDLNKYGAEEIVKDHFEANINNNTVEGRLVAMPWYTDAGLLFYRTDLLKKYGYSEPPKTWDELEGMATRIQKGERAERKEDFWGYVWQGNAYEGLTCNALEWIYSNGGGTIINKDKEITIYNPEAVAAVKQAAGWVGSISPASVTGLIEESSRHIWQSGNAAFMRNWPYAYQLGNAADSVIKGKFALAPLPAGDSGFAAAALGGWQLAVSKYSKNIEIAADVVKFMTSYDAQKYRAIEESYNPTIKALYRDKEVLEVRPYYNRLYDVFMSAVARPTTVTSTKYNEVSALFFRAVHSVLTGKDSADNALGYLQLDLQSVTGFETSSPETK